ncbi:MAG TPA: DUF2784 domain-containing protein [Pseudonocardia sp.]|nr:DUF2784 domain-containing protein [Pseudonocardia sp.]
MRYQLLAELVMLLHFGFLVYVSLGGFLAWRRPWLIVPHAAAAAWGAITATVGIPCPLTAWEDAARRRAGEAGLERGFIDTYLTGVVYPQEHLLTAQLLVAVLVAVSWTGLVVRLRRRTSA